MTQREFYLMPVEAADTFELLPQGLERLNPDLPPAELRSTNLRTTIPHMLRTHRINGTFMSRRERRWYLMDLALNE